MKKHMHTYFPAPDKTRSVWLGKLFWATFTDPLCHTNHFQACYLILIAHPLGASSLFSVFTHSLLL